jgi:hypothetical protein
VYDFIGVEEGPKMLSGGETFIPWTINNRRNLNTLRLFLINDLFLFTFDLVMTFRFSISQLLSYKLKTVINITKVATLPNIGKSCERLPTPVKQETRQQQFSP